MKLTSLEKLNLGWNQIDAEGCAHLAPALAKMISLKWLVLCGNNDIEAKKGCEQLAPALAKMTTLKELNLGEYFWCERVSTFSPCIGKDDSNEKSSFG